ncbi:MAG: OmpA family protein [Nitrospirae bacterium]|nr:OmpA family protein [Nitrospirota bacterium]
MYYPTTMIEADKALEEARSAGKDKECPDEFNALKQTVDKTYPVYESCHTEEAIQMAKDALGKIKALCPAKPAPMPVRVPEPKPEPKPEVQVAPKAAPVVVKKEIMLEDVHFDLNKATLTDEAKAILRRNIEVLKENPDVKVGIVGHTSAAASAAYNQKLSERRVMAVKAFLVKEGGISPDRLTTSAYGKTKLAEPEPNPLMRETAAAKFNRRVTFTILNQ